MERAVYERLRQVEDVHWWFQARRDILDACLRALPLPEDARILEVGCGSGGNLGLLQRFGQVSGVEPDADSRAWARARAGVEVADGRLPDLTGHASDAYDLVAALDVIEHLDEDAAAVRTLARLARPGGWVFATVPAAPRLWSRHDEQHHHKRRYRLAAFRGLFEDAGLEPVRATHFNTLLYPPIAAMRLAGALLRREGDDEALPPPWLNATLRAVMRSERRLLPRLDLPFGVSALVVARKPLAAAPALAA